jgi:hypothetical protein
MASDAADELDLLSSDPLLEPRNEFPTRLREEPEHVQDIEMTLFDVVDTNLLHEWLIANVIDDNFKAADTVVVFTDSKPLNSYEFFNKTTAGLWHQRLRWKNQEKMHAVFVPILAENSLTSGHITHASVHVMRSLRARFPCKHFISSDNDLGPTALSEVCQWLQVARTCEEKKTKKSLPEDAMPGLLVCTETFATVNAGLYVSPGVAGPSDLDKLAQTAGTAQSWSQLLEVRMEYLLDSAKHRDAAEYSNQQYGPHVAALASHTALAGVLVEEPQDFLHLFATICNVLSVAAWPPSSERFHRARLQQFSKNIRLATPRLDGWAGPFCEQPVLAYLAAFQSPKCFISYMASEYGFMKQFASKSMGSRDNIGVEAVMPPLFLHGYSRAAKIALTNFSLDYWVNMSQSLQGALQWQPCFLDGKQGSSVRVEASCGFQVEIQIPVTTRRMVHENNWERTSPTCNTLFAGQLPHGTTDAATWPLWSDLVEELRINGTVDLSARTSVVPPSSVLVACPGLQSRVPQNGGSGHKLFGDNPHVVFTNSGADMYYSVTHEKAAPEEGRRTADQTLDALHFLLRDEGAQSAWDKVLPNRLAVCQQRPVYFCPSWLADPCASSVFVVLASVCQHSSYADRYLSLFGFRNDSVDTKVGSSSDSGQSMVDYTNDSDESGIDSGETNHSTALRFPSPAFDASIHGCLHFTLIACAF